MSAQEETTPARPAAKKAPWQSMPGAPTRPNIAHYGPKLAALAEQRRTLIDKIKKLQSSVQNDAVTQARHAERNAFFEELNEIDARRKVQRDRRAAQDAEIAKLRKHRGEISDKLRAVQAEVGGFTNVREIDEAIDYMMRKMESSGGGLGAERRNQQRLHKLEDAKTHLLRLQPLADAIKQITEQEVILQQEYHAICEQIGILNREYEEKLQKKRAKDKEAQADGTNRADVYKQCDELRTRVSEITQCMDSLRAEREKVSSEWDAWNKEARKKYFEQLEQQREKRRKEYEERRNAHKIAAKRVRAAKRQNPYVTEISACSTLIQYLKQKKMMVQLDEEDRKRREAAAHFDPSQMAPAGCVVVSESKWSENKSLGKTAKKQQKHQQKQKENTSAAKPSTAVNDQKGRALQHPVEKIRLFQMIDVDPALSLATIDDKIRHIETLKSQYESHIQTGELVLSSGDDEEEEEADDSANTPLPKAPEGAETAGVHATEEAA
ncbi:conserved hypothetical protein [Leishmania infantum JPCM5]|uniref:Nuclear_segregation_protein_-_putative n=2 Tax=Leishmania infantum TaxID=5671 RepID=A0A6L0XL78_LEIIN|nr:conserved hypothetical protein [Leishmania infantum JPCM5]CAC9522598.1 nuclear_segregation_protein_-_putative [Leishmania infantum]CAM70749.1 conserved hypothetical protein [Leishmania infantum JPCM5]SUZ44565.1 nuclear_segregation_protein_-_putative [Leishmania infantum]|eukprot:XP_001467684.1 conserved hypothetical protein [Leishmania infantum JPCM5]